MRACEPDQDGVSAPAGRGEDGMNARTVGRQRPTRRQLEVLRAYIATGSIRPGGRSRAGHRRVDGPPAPLGATRTHRLHQRCAGRLPARRQGTHGLQVGRRLRQLLGQTGGAPSEPGEPGLGRVAWSGPAPEVGAGPVSPNPRRTPRARGSMPRWRRSVASGGGADPRCGHHGVRPRWCGLRSAGAPPMLGWPAQRPRPR